MKIYFNPIKNQVIEDISGKKTIKGIKKQFGDAVYQTAEIDDTIETYTTANGVIEKRTLQSVGKETEAERTREKKIQDEIRRIAIRNLQSRGEL